jgi:hypothetical protein
MQAYVVGSHNSSINRDNSPKFWEWFWEDYKICHTKYNIYQSIKMGFGQVVSTSWSSLVITNAAMVTGCFPVEAGVDRKERWGSRMACVVTKCVLCEV